MTVQNIYGSKPKDMLGMIQQELLTARAEILKQNGISKELVRVLGNMKRNVIEEIYPTVTVLHDKYGECKWNWHVESFGDSIILSLKYCVKSIPLDGLSKHDKVIARKYNRAYGYLDKYGTYREFKSFKERIVGSIEWTFSIDDMTDEIFLKKKLRVSEQYKPFTILLEG